MVVCLGPRQTEFKGKATFMRIAKLAAPAIFCAGFIFIAGAEAATEHYHKEVAVLELAYSDCYFFKLGGVTEADSSVPNSPWFAIQKNQPNAKEMYAILMSLRLAGGTLARVVTTDNVVCGHAQVGTLDL